MMKGRIFSTFAFMNEQLFDSFPSMVMDEMLLGGSFHGCGMAGPNDPQTNVEACA